MGQPPVAPLSAEAAQAVADAAAEGLTLEPSTHPDNTTGYNGVRLVPSGRFVAKSMHGSHGTHALAEEPPFFATGPSVFCSQRSIMA